MLEPAPAVRKTQPVLAPPGVLKCEPAEHSSTHPCRDLGLTGIVFCISYAIAFGLQATCQRETARKHGFSYAARRLAQCR